MVRLRLALPLLRSLLRNWRAEISLAGLRPWSLCDPAAQVPAVLRRVRGCASDSVHRPSGGYFSCLAETGATALNVQKTGDSMVQFWMVVDMPLVANDRAVVQTVLKTVVFRRCSTLTVWSMSVAVHRRFGRPCEHAATVSRHWRCSDSVHRQSQRTFQLLQRRVRFQRGWR